MSSRENSSSAAGVDAGFAVGFAVGFAAAALRCVPLADAAAGAEARAAGFAVSADCRAVPALLLLRSQPANGSSACAGFVDALCAVAGL